MQKCTCSNIYENEILRESLGETLRPGGFSLTERALEFTDLKKDDRVLDIGSGMGDTVNYLIENYGLKAMGVDPSDILILESKKKYPNINILKGVGEKLPVEDKSLEGVFAECTLSLMDDLDKVLEECSRTLKKGGYLVITDVYARRPEYMQELNDIKFKSCLRGMLNLENLVSKLKSKGFNVMVVQDQTDCLRQLTVKLIFKFGSMGIFWNKISGCGDNMEEFKEILSRCKVGYFLIICKKD